MADEPLQEKASIIPTATTSVVNVPMPSKEEGQRSINITDLFITRWTPPWSRPPSLPAYTWRAWVLNQPVAVACREALISMLIGLDWQISARNTDDKEDLAATIRYYTKLFEHGGYYLGSDFSTLLEWVLGDLLDIPFGGAVEVGRKGDDPKGRVVFLRPLDGGTLYPTLNKQFPVVQYYQGYTAVAFPDYAVARLQMTPRPEIFREGWGIAPPEKIYFALDMLNRGDKYYANLLLDVPPAGILDLGDMEESSAKTWIGSFKDFAANTTDAFRIPVLYEHNNPVNFLPFGKVPNDIMYDHITLKYAALVCAAYGIALNDIGLQTTSRSGETLAGSIRASVQTRRTGIARLKAKVKSWLEHMLPDTLMFDFVDYDDEHNVAMGRARLATATGLNLMVTAGSLSAEEARMQMIKDGLIDIPIPLAPPPDAKPMLPGGMQPQGGAKKGAQSKNNPKNPGALGHGVPPSMGGEGELRSFVKRGQSFDANVDRFVRNTVAAIFPQVLQNIYQFSDDEIIMSKSLIDDDLFHDTSIIQQLSVLSAGKPKLNLNQGWMEEPPFPSQNLFKDEKKRKDFTKRLQDGVNGLLAKSIAEELNNVLYDMAVTDITQSTMETELDGDPSGPTVDMDSVCEQVKSRVVQGIDRTLYDYVYSLIPNQPVEEKAEAKEVTVEKSLPDFPDPLGGIRIVPMQAQPVQPLTQTINFPPIHVNVPERSMTLVPPDVHVDVQSPDMFVQPPDVNVHVDAPAVHIQPPDVTVNVDKSDTHPITVNVPEQNVTVNVPKQEAPVVNVNVEPTPIEVNNTVNVPEPKPTNKVIHIQKNVDGSWTGESETNE